jgi:CHASE3 domain sensor protein
MNRIVHQILTGMFEMFVLAAFLTVGIGAVVFVAAIMGSL